MNNQHPINKHSHRLISGYLMTIESFESNIRVSTPEISAILEKINLSYQISETGNPLFETLLISNKVNTNSIFMTIQADDDGLLRAFLESELS